MPYILTAEPCQRRSWPNVFFSIPSLKISKILHKTWCQWCKVCLYFRFSSHEKASSHTNLVLWIPIKKKSWLKRFFFFAKFTQTTKLSPAGAIATKRYPCIAVFLMCPLCIWTVHMSQGVHVWLLHGSILYTHWNSPVTFTYPEEEKTMWILKAILDHASYFRSTSVLGWTTNPDKTLELLGASLSMFAGNDLLNPFVPSLVEYETHVFELVLVTSCGNGPLLLDQLHDVYCIDKTHEIRAQRQFNITPLVTVRIKFRRIERYFSTAWTLPAAAGSTYERRVLDFSFAFLYFPTKLCPAFKFMLIDWIFFVMVQKLTLLTLMSI